MSYNIADKIYDNQLLIERICYSFCSGAADRQDLFQEIVYKVLKSHKSFSDSSYSFNLDKSSIMKSSCGNNCSGRFIFAKEITIDLIHSSP